MNEEKINKTVLELYKIFNSMGNQSTIQIAESLSSDWKIIRMSDSILKVEKVIDNIVYHVRIQIGISVHISVQWSELSF